MGLLSYLGDLHRGLDLFRTLRRTRRQVASTGVAGSVEGTWLIPRNQIAGFSEKTNVIDVRGGYEELAVQRSPAERAVAARLDRLSGAAEYPRVPGGFMQALGYKRNEVVRGAFNLILNAKTQARPELQAADGTRVPGVLGEEFDQLMLCPSGVGSDLTGADLFRRIYLDALNTGNWLLEMVPGTGTAGRPVRLWRMDPSRVAVMPASIEEQQSDPDARVAHYLYRVNGTWFPVPTERVIHWRNWDGVQEFFGVPDLFAALRSLATDVDLVDLMKTTLKNMGVVPHVLEYPLKDIMQQVEKGTLTFVPQRADLEEIRDRWAEGTTGANRGKAMVGWGYTVKAIGLDFDQLAIGDLVATTERRISMALNVPILLLNMQGVQGGDQGKNYGEAKEAFYLGPIASRLLEYGAVFSARLAPLFVRGGRVELRTDHIATIREAKLKRLPDAGAAMHFLSRHVLQRLVGEPVHGPDVFYRPGGVLAIPEKAKTEPQSEVEGLGVEGI